MGYHKQMKKRIHTYLLPYYANLSNLEENRGEREHESKITFNEGGLNLELSETNSLIEEQYSLNIKSSKYILEGVLSKNEIREAMIHHPYRHPWKHLQFTLEHEHEVIRIILDPVDEDDYQNCIKSFLHLCQDLMMQEMKDNKIKINLPEYFFNERIKELESHRYFLLDKVRRAFESGNVLNYSEQPIDRHTLSELKREKYLLPFLNWKD